MGAVCGRSVIRVPALLRPNGAIYLPTMGIIPKFPPPDQNPDGGYTVANGAVKTEAGSQGCGSLNDAQIKPRNRRVCGLRRPTFWMLVVLAGVIVVAAAGRSVGGYYSGS